MFQFVEESLNDVKDPRSTAPVGGNGATSPASQTEGVVYTMPEKFLTPAAGVGSQKGLLVGLGVLGVLVIVGTVGALVYFNAVNTPSSAPLATIPSVDTVPASSTEPEPPSSGDIPAEVVEGGASDLGVGSPDGVSGDVLPPAAVNPIALLSRAQDSDGDGLTDEEEGLYGTDPQLPDSDNDGYHDGLEVTSLYDPGRGGSARLEASSVVTLFKNATYRFGFLYPAGWTTTQSDGVSGADRAVTLTTATDEYIEVVVLDNPDRLDVSEWYTRTTPGIDLSAFTPTSYDVWTLLEHQNGVEAYLTQKDSNGVTLPFVYIVKYGTNLGASTPPMLHFKSTFTMLARSMMLSTALLPK